MNYFHNNLKGLRIEYGFDSAKQFYDSLIKSGESAFNYQYYVRIEKGDATPSSKVLNALVKHFNKKDQESLIKSWCQTQFPEHSYIFGQKPIAFTKTSFTQGTPKHSNELSIEQIHILAENKNNYFIFILITLSRSEIKISDLKQFFSPEELSQALKRLCIYNLILCTEEVISAKIVDRIFPRPNSQKLREIYEDFDKWDEEITNIFEFQNLITRKFMRRISFRHISLIEKQLNLVFELIRTADETEAIHNNHVIQLQVKLSNGELPG